MPSPVNRGISGLAPQSISALGCERFGCELWLDDSGVLMWPQFAAAVERVVKKCNDAGVQRGEVVITSGESTVEALVWLFGVAAVGAIAAPLRDDRLGEVQGWKKFLAVGWHEWEGQLERGQEGSSSALASRLLGELRDRNHSGLILATGGSTGIPKVVLHDLDGLLSTVPVKDNVPRRILPLMRFDHIGGLDMAWRAIAGRQVLVAPPAEITPEAVAVTIERHRVEVLPATPSFLNLLLLAGVHATHDLSSLRVVPYGAETMPIGLLARLRATFPKIDFVQRFGTSETGALPVRDNGSGLLLRNGDSGYAWKIVEGELWVRSPSRALGYLSQESDAFDSDGWFRTGDLAEQTTDGAIRILGRRANLMNVGGEKVLPGEVEEVLLTHPLVADCRVEAEPNAVLGQVVAAEIVWSGPETDALTVKRILHSFASMLLPRHKLPAVVRLVSSVDTTRNLKKFRFVNA